MGRHPWPDQDGFDDLRPLRRDCETCYHPLTEHGIYTGCRHELAPATCPGQGAETRSAVLCPCRGDRR